MTFGPEGDQWHYSRASKTYDLTRGAASAHTVKTTYGPENTFISIAPELSALVIVDMQNFFLHPSCREHPTGLAAVEPTLKLIEKCRAVGIQVSSTSMSKRSLRLTNSR
jgi:phosphatidylethanolamine-binding protein